MLAKSVQVFLKKDLQKKPRTYIANILVYLNNLTIIQEMKILIIIVSNNNDDNNGANYNENNSGKKNDDNNSNSSNNFHNTLQI